MTGRLLIVAGCLAACIPVLRGASATDPVPLKEPLDRFPSTIAEWRAQPTAPFDAAVVARLGADDVLNRAYAGADLRPVVLFVGYYGSQRTGDRAHYPMSCLPGQGWQPTQTGTVDLDVDVGDSRRTVSVNRYVIQKGLSEQVMFFWYQSHGRAVTSEYWSKYYLVVDALRLKRTDTAMVRVLSEVTADDRGGRAAADARGQRFVQALYPVIHAFLPQ